jgi:hypothetical protein
MPTYQPPTNNMRTAFDDVRALDCHRERLADVTIAVKGVYASRDKDDLPRGEALSRDGDPILGKIRIMKEEDRSDGSADVRVLLHGDRWGQLSAGMQRAVIDICLTRIEVVEKDGKPALDGLYRPILRKRKWGYQHCGFVEVDERYGLSSPGVHNLRLFFNDHGQVYMPWLDEDPPDDFLSVPLRPPKSAKPLPEGDTIYKRGKLAAKRLRERIEIQKIDALPTILGLVALELSERPRDDVIGALEAKIREHRALPDYVAIEKGKKPSVEPDLAAATLLTMTKKEATLDMLDRLVPECLDAQVLASVAEGEGDSPREEVLEVINRRIRELDR